MLAALLVFGWLVLGRMERRKTPARKAAAPAKKPAARKAPAKKRA